MIMKCIFLFKSEDETWKNQLIQQTFFILFYNMSKWRMKEQPSPFIICSAMLQDLQWPFKLKKKKAAQKRKLPVTEEVTIKDISMCMVYNELMTINQTKTMTLRINKIWTWEHPNRCFSSAFVLKSYCPASIV